ncbi:MAG: hypothetical protein AAF206_21175 [Bacteroidota bacterium]
MMKGLLPKVALAFVIFVSPIMHSFGQQTSKTEKHAKKKKSVKVKKAAQEMQLEMRDAANKQSKKEDEDWGELEAAGSWEDEILAEEPVIDEDSIKARIKAQRKARKERSKSDPRYYIELAKEDLLRRYPFADDMMEPMSSGRIVFTFWNGNTPACAIYDSKGKWEGTYSVLNNNQLTTGMRRVIDEMGMEIKDFGTKVKIESKEFARPLFGMMSASKKPLTADTLLTNEQVLKEHVIAGVDVAGEGKHFVFGENIQRIEPAFLAFSGVFMMADGNGVRIRDLEILAKGDLLIFPEAFITRPWQPNTEWASKNPLHAVPNWQPDPRWYPDATWYVNSGW